MGGSFATATVDDFRRILQRHLNGLLSSDDLGRWAETIEGRDDIVLDPPNQEALAMIIFTLANPDDHAKITPDAAKALIDWLGTQSGLV